MEYVEKDCTFEVQGKRFTSGGAVVTDQRALVYAFEREGKVGTWQGDQKVPAYFGNTWRGNMGDTRQAVTFTWEGKRYAGIYYKSAGDIVRARALKG